jgi:hypothetical protein
MGLLYEGTVFTLKTKIMKILITFALIIVMVVSGLTSLYFFRASEYDLSHVLVIATYLSIVFAIYELTVDGRKNVSA